MRAVDFMACMGAMFDCCMLSAVPHCFLVLGVFLSVFYVLFKIKRENETAF